MAQIKPARHRQPWDEWEDQYLHEHWSRDNIQEVADALQRTKITCQHRASRIGAVPQPDTCVRCGNPIIQPKVGKRRIHCTIECAEQAHKESQRKGERSFACAECNTKFLAERKRRYCTRLCSQRSYERRQNEASKAARLETGATSMKDPKTQILVLSAMRRGMTMRAIEREHGVSQSSISYYLRTRDSHRQ